MREQYINRVAKSDSIAANELSQLSVAKKSYQAAFEANHQESEEYKTYTASLDQLAQTEVK